MLNYFKRKAAVFLGVMSFVAFSSICYAQKEFNIGENPPPPNRQQINALVQEVNRHNQEGHELNAIATGIAFRAAFLDALNPQQGVAMVALVPQIMASGTGSVPDLDANTFSNVHRQLIDEAQSYYVRNSRHLEEQQALQAQLDQARRLMLASRENGDAV